MNNNWLIGGAVLALVTSCSGDVKKEQELSEEVSGIVTAIKDGGAVPEKSREENLLQLRVVVPRELAGTQFMVELGVENGFQPLIMLEVDSIGLINGDFRFVPNAMYRLSSQKGSAFFFTDRSDLSFSLIPEPQGFRLGNSNSEESKKLNDYIVFASTLPQGEGGLKAILDYLDAHETGYIHYINSAFVAQYAAEYPSLVKRLREDFSDEERYPYAKNFELSFVLAPQVGEVAPDITLPSLDGGTDRLSNYRGKYVLIDFWASWCGPCRLENPNVLNVYNKYRDKGFDIFGVSLDKDQKKWELAVQQDGIIWPQVSDLKSWQSIAVKKYKVTGIPYTVLLDKQGVILATGLRGRDLEKKLKELF